MLILPESTVWTAIKAADTQNHAPVAVVGIGG